MEWEADRTQNTSLRHCLAYVSAITAGVVHAEENHLPLSSSNRPLSHYYQEEFLGDPTATIFDEQADLLRIAFTGSHIAQGWLEHHSNSHAAKAIAANPDASFRMHRRLVYEILTEVKPHLPNFAPPTEEFLTRMKDEYLERRNNEMFPPALFTIPPLVPDILRSLLGMVHQGEIDPETAQQAQQEVDRAISEGEITQEEGVELLEPWGTSPSLNPIIPEEQTLGIIRGFRAKVSPKLLHLASLLPS